MMHTIMYIEWSTSFPHRAMASARRGGMWHLTVRPRKEWPMFEWHIAHDTDGHLSEVGHVSTANFAKGQAELALLGLDAKEG